MPIDDSYAEWTVRSGGASGPVVASGWASAAGGSGWDGIDDVTVDAQSEPYYVYIYWWDAWWWEDGVTIHYPVYVTVSGSVQILRY
jgi:hypothetical protein